MGREIRRVPPGWEPPKRTIERIKVDESGPFSSIIPALVRGETHMVEECHPHCDKSFERACREWDEGKAAWDRHEGDDWECNMRIASHNDTETTWEEWAGERPDDPLYYRPDWTPEEATHYQVYETVSEGTPVSPAFATLQEVEAWCIGQGYSPGAARAFCRGGWAPSMVIADGAIYNDIESAKL